MSPQELNNEIGKGQFRSVYYFYGVEDYRIKEAEKYLLSKFLPKTQLSTNHTTLSAIKNKLADILNELSIVPMLGERQAFTINNVQSLTPAQLEKILGLLNPPDPNRVVILTTPSSKIPRKNTKFFKFISTAATPVEFARLRRDSAAKRVRTYLAQNKVEIEPEALKMLVDVTDGNFGGLLAEIGKLVDYAGEGGLITKDIISQISSDYRTFKIFEIAEHTAVGDYDMAIATVDFLLGRGERASGMTFWLGEHFIGLYLTQNRKKFGKRDVSWKYRGQTNLFDNQQLEEIIHRIAAADAELRQNIKPPRLIMEELVLNICQLSKKVKNV